MSEATVFISYSHRDDHWKDRLVQQLGVLQRQGILSVWSDREIPGGDPWEEQIQQAMDRSSIAVLLISPRFLSSEFILTREIPPLLRLRKERGLCLFPVILEHVDLQAVDWLRSLQCRPKDARPLSSFSDSEAEEQLASIAKELRLLLNRAKAPTKSGPSTDVPRGQTDAEADLTEAAGISKRLRLLLKLINRGRTYEKLTVSKVALELDSTSVGKIERYFVGIEDPPFSFLRAISDRFGVQEAWLLHGELKPFYQPEPSELMPHDFLPYIEEAKPKTIFFVRAQSEIGECVIVLEFDDWKYHVLDGLVRTSSHVGGTGAAQLVSLHRLLDTLEARKCRIRGEILDNDLFWDLVNGRVFPGFALERRIQIPDWVIAFMDLRHELSSAPKFREWYGQPFLDGQRIVARKLEEDPDSH